MAVTYVRNARIDLIRPGTDLAIDKALHAADRDRYHERLLVACPFCGDISARFAEAFSEIRSDTELGQKFRDVVGRIMDRQDHDNDG